MTPPSALIDFRPAVDGDTPLRLAFGAPREVLLAHAPGEVAAVLAQAEAAARAGAWCVGWLRYEAAPAFDRAFAVHAHDAADGPLACFGVHDAPLAGDGFDAPGVARVDWQPGLERARFDARIARILEAIAAGECYQINLTAALHGRLEGDALALFAALRRAQPNAFAAYVDLAGTQVLSVSPELFFDWRDGQLVSRPMKGTAARGHDAASDARAAAALASTEKERAENLMIVDLIRNDVSRIALPHTVRVPRLFHTEAWPTVWQMTSDVTARTRPGTTLAEVFGALFPCGSVTGAPKIRAMQLIRELEDGPRGVYCGALGVIRPGGAATFNVPIRTLELRAGRARCGIGSGITADARAEPEWQEWRAKRGFVERASAPFELLQTLRLDDGRAVHGAEHLARLRAAALHFGVPWQRDAAERALAALAAQHPHGDWRARLLLALDGRAQATAVPLEPTAQPVRVQLATRAFEAADSEFTRFKTTRRAHYDAFAPTEPGVFDMLLWNARGELTEFTRGHVAVRLDGRWCTPPLACGLLDGVGRAVALREGRLEERVIRVDELPRAEGLAFLNSLRGWIEARLG